MPSIHIMDCIAILRVDAVASGPDQTVCGRMPDDRARRSTATEPPGSTRSMSSKRSTRGRCNRSEAPGLATANRGGDDEPVSLLNVSRRSHGLRAARREAYAHHRDPGGAPRVAPGELRIGHRTLIGSIALKVNSCPGTGGSPVSALGSGFLHGPLRQLAVGCLNPEPTAHLPRERRTAIICSRIKR